MMFFPQNLVYKKFNYFQINVLHGISFLEINHFNFTSYNKNRLDFCVEFTYQYIWACVIIFTLADISYL